MSADTPQTTHDSTARDELLRQTEAILRMTNGKRTEHYENDRALVEAMRHGRDRFSAFSVLTYVFEAPRFTELLDDTEITLAMAIEYIDTYASTQADGTYDLNRLMRNATKLVAGKINYSAYTNLVFAMVLAFVLDERYPESDPTSGANAS